MSAAKRRRQAVNRRRWMSELQERWDLRLGRIPRDAIRAMVCSCGSRMWLREGATPEDHELFDLDVSAHDYCGQEVAS